VATIIEEEVEMTMMMTMGTVLLLVVVVLETLTVEETINTEVVVLAAQAAVIIHIHLQGVQGEPVNVVEEEEEAEEEEVGPVGVHQRLAMKSLKFAVRVDVSQTLKWFQRTLRTKEGLLKVVPIADSSTGWID
jgi:hypothetical protein